MISETERHLSHGLDLAGTSLGSVEIAVRRRLGASESDWISAYAILCVFEGAGKGVEGLRRLRSWGEGGAGPARALRAGTPSLPTAQTKNGALPEVQPIDGEDGRSLGRDGEMWVATRSSRRIAS